MNAKILHEISSSETKNVFHFGKFSSYNILIEFEETDENKWIASFCKGYEKGDDQIIIDRDNKTAFILASGYGYLLNLTMKELIVCVDDNQSIMSVLYCEKFNYILYSDFKWIYVFKGCDLIKIIEPAHFIYPSDVDGVHMNSCNDQKVFGYVEEITSDALILPFEMDLETFEVSYPGNEEKESFRKNLLIAKAEKEKHKE